MTEDATIEDVIELVSGTSLLALVLFLFVDVGWLYLGVALLATIMLLLGFFYKLSKRKLDYAFLIGNLSSPIALIIYAVLILGGGAIVGGLLGLLAGPLGSIAGFLAGTLIGSILVGALQLLFYLLWLILGIILFLQGLDYLPTEERMERAI